MKIKRYKVTIILLILFIYVPLTASAQCIGVVTAGGGQQYWQAVIGGSKKAATELGLTIYARGAVDETDSKGQRYILDLVINKKMCQGVVLAPNSVARLSDVAQLKARGIPTVYIDRDIGGDRVSVIKTNNAEAGVLAGKEMVNVLNGKGKVAVLGLKKGVVTTSIREEAFIKEVQTSGIEVIIDEYLGSGIGIARQRALDILKDADEIDGIFTSNELTTVAVITALKRLNKSGTIVHIGFDAHSVIIQSLMANELHGFIAQDPFQMGYLGVLNLYQIMQGKEVEAEVTVKAILVNKKNISAPEVKDILKVYLNPLNQKGASP